MCLCFQGSYSRTGPVCSCGSVTVWTHWDTFGRRAAPIKHSVTTAPVLTDNSSAPITAVKPPAHGAPGQAGLHAALPVGGARGLDTGKTVITHSHKVCSEYK